MEAQPYAYSSLKRGRGQNNAGVSTIQSYGKPPGKIACMRK